MLDLHALSSGGSVTLANIGTIAAGGDGASAAGVPISPDATLFMWGGLTTIADTIRELKLVSQDLVDPLNAEYLTFGASSLVGALYNYDNLPFKKGTRQVWMRQNTGAANNMAFLMDYYDQNGNCISGNQKMPNKVIINQAFGGALTAITWGSQAVSPTYSLPVGKYAILGSWTTGLTNYGLQRFNHADFKGMKPGFPVIDMNTTAVANAVLPKDPLTLNQGYQFVHLSQITNKPMVPTFNVTGTGTGLTIEMAAITADTPTATLNLAKVG